MIKIIKLLKPNELSIKKEFEEYKRIIQYLNENPNRIEPEERYVTKIVDKLIEFSMFNEEISQNLRDSISKTLEDFLNKNKDNGYHYI